MPPSAAAIGNIAVRRAGQMAHSEFAFDLQPHDQEEDRQQRIVHPMQQRHLEYPAAERKTQLGSHKAAKASPNPELVSATARTVASNNDTPAEGAQLAKLKAAVRTRCPSDPSIASVKELSSHGPS